MAQEKTVDQPSPGGKRPPRPPDADGRESQTEERLRGDSPRRDRWTLVAFLLAAALIRAWSVLTLRSDLRIAEPIIDGRYYLDLATRLAHGGGWPAGPIFMTPLYPLLLSIVFRLGGSDVFLVQVFQSLLGLATLAFLFAAVQRDLGRRAAVAAAALYILCGPVLAMESLVLTESLLLFLLAVSLWAWPGRNRAPAAPAIFGIACGLLAIGRGVFLLLPLAWAGWTFLEVRLGGATRRREPAAPRSGERLRPGTGSASARRAHAPAGGSSFVRSLVFVIAGVMVVLLPLAVKQSRATGRPQVLALNGGLNLYLGNNPAARGLYSMPAGIDLQRDITGTRSASVLAGRPLTPAQADRFYAGRATTFLRERPARAFWLLGRKALLFLSPHEIPQIENFDALRAGAAPLRIAFVDFRWILPLAVLGVAAAWLRRTASPAPAAGPGRLYASSWALVVIVGWLSTILFFATGRYRVPFLAGFLGLAGLGASELVAIAQGVLRKGRAGDAGRDRSATSTAGSPGETSRLIPLRLLLVPAVVGLQLVLPGYPTVAALAYDATQLGVREARRGNAEAALRHHQEAVRLSPTFGEAWHGAGAALAQLGRLPESVEAYRHALQYMPGSPVTHYNLGAVYGRMGDDAAALAQFREAVRLDPFDPAYHSDLGIALARTGDRAGAGAEFRRALALDPSHLPARRGLEALEAGR